MGTVFSKVKALFSYRPPKVWTYLSQGGTFGGINRPTAGPRKIQALPIGKHALQLHSLGTPNGQKVTVLLEELNLTYGLEYDSFPVNIMDGSQFSTGFCNVNPNSKIPALYHFTTPDEKKIEDAIRVFESASILMYLCETFDIQNIFLPPVGNDKRTECLNWLFWVQGSAPFLGGGFGHFFTYAPIKIKYAIDRYTMETKRQLDVLERHLSGVAEDGCPKHKFAGGPYLCGDLYTIADICCFPWYGNLVLGNIYKGSPEFLQINEYPHVIAWAKRIMDRKAVQRGLIVNKTFGDGNKLHERHSAKDFNQFNM